MHRLRDLISMIDHTLNTKRKKHIASGILTSTALLLGGLALTIMTLKTEEDDEQIYID
jgi:hypothetical protein